MEKYVGFSESVGSDLSMFACNLKGIPNERKLIELIDFFNSAESSGQRGEGLRSLGDIIMLNNTDYANENEKLPDMTYVPDFAIDLNWRGKKSALSWKRSIDFEGPN